MAAIEGPPADPMSIYGTAEKFLHTLVTATDASQAAVNAANKALDAAHRSNDVAKGHEKELTSSVIEAIHEAGSQEGADPVNYVQAVTLAIGRGSAEAVQANENLAAMQRRITQSKPTQVAIVGGINSVLAIGMSAGGMIARKVNRRYSTDSYSGIGIWLPLRNLHTYGLYTPGERQPDAPPRYVGRDGETHEAGVGQWPPIAIVDSLKEVRRASERADNRSGTTDDYDAIRATGMTPVVAYGKLAVTEVLKALVGDRGKHPQLHSGDVAAMALQVDIDPSVIMGEGEARSALLKRLADGVGMLVHSQVTVDDISDILAFSPNLRPPYWPSAATETVLQYLDAEPGHKEARFGVVTAATKALAEVFASAQTRPGQARMDKAAKRVADSLGHVFGIEVNEHYLSLASDDHVLSSLRPRQTHLLKVESSVRGVAVR